MRQLLSLATLTQHDRLHRKNACYILQVAGNRLPVYLKATCRMYSYHAIYSRAACTDDHVALCMGYLRLRDTVKWAWFGIKPFCLFLLLPMRRTYLQLLKLLFLKGFIGF